MRKFIAEYPIFAIILSSCLGTIFFISLSTGLLILGGIKLSKSLASSSSLKTEFNKKSDKFSYYQGKETSKNKLLSIPIRGVIYTEQVDAGPLAGWANGETYGYSIKKSLLDAAKDPSIRGIILEINSPGGTISGANAILEGVEQYKALTKKPVIAHVMGLAASGGYMAALAADHIYAEPGSLVGSIGVIMGPFKYYDKVMSEGSAFGAVTTQNGIESYHITAGTDKDLGDPYKKLSENARQTLQNGVNNEYENFVEKVATLRGIDKKQITETLGALVYDNKSAETYKLIDGTSTQENTYKILADDLKIVGDDYQIVTIKQNSFWKDLFEASGLNKNIKPSASCELCGKMLYLYGAPETYLK